MPTATAKRANPYSVHPGVRMMEDWVRTLPDKTGRSLDQWIALVKKEGPGTEEGRRDWLKTRHRLGTNSAWWIAERSVGKGGEDDSPGAYLKAAAAWVEEMFVGKRAALRPIYDALLEAGLAAGPEAKACPCKTIVPLYHEHVFAQIKPATSTRIDLGLALGAHRGRLPKRLIDTGGLAKKDRITHRIQITALEQIDGDVEHWLKTAYELDA